MILTNNTLGSSTLSIFDKLESGSQFESSFLQAQKKT